MATIQAINECLEALKKTPSRNIINESPIEIDLKFLGIKTLIDECKLVELSERKQRRHKRENEMLFFLYRDHIPFR